MRFAAVGVAGTLLYAVLAFGFNAGGLPIMVSHGVASALSLIASYFGQKLITFRISGEHVKRGSRFFVATALLVTVQSTMVFVLDRVGVPQNLTLLISTLYYPPASYLIHTFWTFR